MRNGFAEAIEAGDRLLGLEVKWAATLAPMLRAERDALDEAFTKAEALALDGEAVDGYNVLSDAVGALLGRTEGQ